MPVEIRELQIITVVDDTKEKKSQPAAAQTPDMNKIIAECVEQVLEILKQKNER